MDCQCCTAALVTTQLLKTNECVYLLFVLTQQLMLCLIISERHPGGGGESPYCSTSCFQSNSGLFRMVYMENVRIDCPSARRDCFTNIIKGLIEIERVDILSYLWPLKENIQSYIVSMILLFFYLRIIFLLLFVIYFLYYFSYFIIYFFYSFSLKGRFVKREQR